MAAGEVLRHASGVRLNWGDESHYEKFRSLPCRMGDGPTQMRDDHGKPCHLGCAERELARVITTERFGSAESLAQELAGNPGSATTADRVPLAPEGRR